MRDDKCKLFVGNLSFGILDNQLEELFNSVDGVEVKEVAIITDRVSGQPRGFGFVTVANEEMVGKAIEALNNKEVDGRNIAVKQAQPRENHGGNRSDFSRNNFGYDRHRR